MTCDQKTLSPTRLHMLVHSVDDPIALVIDVVRT